MTNCNAILSSHGIFNTIIRDSTKSASDNYTEWLKTATFQEIQQAQAGGLTVALPIKGVPLKFSGDFKQSDYDSWRQEVDSGQARQLTQEEAETVVKKSVAPEMFKAWIDCIRLNAFGVLDYETDNQDGSFSVLFRYSPNSVGDTPPTITGFGATEAACINPPAVGSELPYGGFTTLFKRNLDQRGNYPAANYFMNTTKGTAEGSIAKIIKNPSPPPVTTPKIRAIKVFSASGDKQLIPTAEVSVPHGYKMIGGGARVNWTEPGNLLVASYPKAFNIWVASSKAHSLVSLANIDVWAIAIEDPDDEFDVVIDSLDSPRGDIAEVSVNARSGYQLVGGGAQARVGVAGQLLTASYPIGSNTWHAKSKAHSISDPNVLTAYAISMRPRNGTNPIPIQISSSTGSASLIPKGECNTPAGCNLIGGGALVNWTVAGNLLTANHPKGNAWVAESKAHSVPDSSSITTFAMGIETRYFA